MRIFGIRSRTQFLPIIPFFLSSQRFLHESYGPGGRSSISGINATVFGATGFIGPYVVNRLGQVGSSVIVPYRTSLFQTTGLRLLGDLGQINTAPYHPRNEDSIRASLNQSNVVINLVGKHYNQGVFEKYSLVETNRDIPAKIAQLAKEAGAEKFIHISCVGAAEDSPSTFLRTKFAGEQAVKEAFPGATILRTTRVFGVEDRFINTIAKILKSPVPVLPLIDGGRAKFQPIASADVARAVYAAIESPEAAGQTYELAGPTVYTLKQLLESVGEIISSPKSTLPIPSEIFRYIGRLMERSPLPLMTEDDFVELSQDNVVSGNVKTIKDLGVENLATLESQQLLILSAYLKHAHLQLLKHDAK